MTQQFHTAQQLHAFCMDVPSVQRNLERSYRALDKHVAAGNFDPDKAHRLLLTNVKAAAQLYAQYHGLSLKWWAVFPPCERDGCAALWLKRYMYGRQNNGRA